MDFGFIDLFQVNAIWDAIAPIATEVVRIMLWPLYLLLLLFGPLLGLPY